MLIVVISEFNIDRRRNKLYTHCQIEKELEPLICVPSSFSTSCIKNNILDYLKSFKYCGSICV